MKIKENQTLKQLSSQLSKLEGDLEAMQIDIKNKQKEYSAKIKMANELKEKINKLVTLNEITISEHALLRYFERVLKFDMDEIKQNILTEEVLKLVEELGGSGTYPAGKQDVDGDNYRVTLKNNVVVTVGT